LKTKKEWQEQLKRIGEGWECSSGTLTDRNHRIESEGFPSHTLESVEELTRFIGQRSVLEVGAGTGWFARHLHDRQVKIRAIDSRVGGCTQPIWWRSELYFDVQEMDALSVEKYEEDVIIMIWPCYETDFAFEVARRLKSGQILIYQGESQGGCTANDKFFEFVEKHLEILDDTVQLNLLSYSESWLYDRWTVFTVP
jgi:hypothetical protein